MGHNFSTFINNFYFWKLIPTTSTGMSEDHISNSQNSNEIRKEVKSSKDHDAFSLLRKQHIEYPKDIILGHLSINSLQNKFFLINETKLDESFPSYQFAMSAGKFWRRDRSKFGDRIAFYIADPLPSRTIKIENLSDIEVLTMEITTQK